MSVISGLEPFLERTGGDEKLAILLKQIVAGYKLPKGDPVYDWEIRRIEDITTSVVDVDGTEFEFAPSQTVTTNRWKAPARACVLAWGHRLVPGNSRPTPVAVLAAAVKDGEGKSIKPVVGAAYYAANDGSWFTRSNVDQQTNDAIVHFLSNHAHSGESVSPNSFNPL